MKANLHELFPDAAPADARPFSEVETVDLFALGGMRIMSSPSWNHLSECKP